MGQKVNPVGMRVGIIRDWESRWYAEKDFGSLLMEDLKIRKFLFKKLDKADLARVIVQAMKKQSEVKNPDDPKSWIDYLKTVGVPIDTIGEAVDNVDPLAEPVAPNVVTSSSDPMTKRHKFNTIDETQYGVDMLAVARVFSQLELDAGEFRPVPVTQD